MKSEHEKGCLVYNAETWGIDTSEVLCTCENVAPEERREPSDDAMTAEHAIELLTMKTYLERGQRLMWPRDCNRIAALIERDQARIAEQTALIQLKNRALSALLGAKAYKDRRGKDSYYEGLKKAAWWRAREALSGKANEAETLADYCAELEKALGFYRDKANYQWPDGHRQGKAPEVIRDGGMVAIMALSAARSRTDD